MFVGFLSNKPFSFGWFLLTYNIKTKQFHREDIHDEKDLYKIESSYYRNLFIKTTSVPREKKALSKILSFRDFIKGYAFAKDISMEYVDVVDFKETLKKAPLDLEYDKKCAYYILNYVDYLEYV